MVVYVLAEWYDHQLETVGVYLSLEAAQAAAQAAGGPDRAWKADGVPREWCTAGDAATGEPAGRCVITAWEVIV